MILSKVEKLMENERMRWSYMNEYQLLRRLSAITKEEKLECFARLAIEKNNTYLYNKCKEKQGLTFNESPYNWTNTFEF